MGDTQAWGKVKPSKKEQNDHLLMSRQGFKKNKKNAKMIRMVLFIQKTEDFNFSLWGGGQGKIQAVSLTFNLCLYFSVPNIKEAEINLFFKVLPNFVIINKT